MKKIVSLALGGFFALASINAVAQTYAEEALIFSRVNPGGSARIQAMGGSQVALGGDYSSAFSNPAGLGFFNRSEATFSMGTNCMNATSSYLGNTTSDSKSNFNIPGFSIVFHNDKNKGKLVSGNFAISLTRTNNFNQNFTYQGTNPHNSLIDYFVEQSSGDPKHPYDPNYYPSQFNQNGYSYYTLQRLAFNNYLYLGATVGFPSFNYHSQKTYSESFQTGPLIGFDLTEDYRIKGSGINTTIGAIIRPEDFIQFGLSVDTGALNPVILS